MTDDTLIDDNIIEAVTRYGETVRKAAAELFVTAHVAVARSGASGARGQAENILAFYVIDTAASVRETIEMVMCETPTRAKEVFESLSSHPAVCDRVALSPAARIARVRSNPGPVGDAVRSVFESAKAGDLTDDEVREAVSKILSSSFVASGGTA